MAHRLLQPLFRLSVIVFLLGGVIIVLGQAIGILLGDAQWVAEVETSAQPPTCVVASICGILSFALSYRRDTDPRENADAATGDRSPERAAAVTRPE
ncbi:hypothetical protein [Streptomyces sp. S465]|uniref:hypothetical protein n=1 Tax=Streptomyces sp. S465 TaxID=2979468 RepID=UPI0022A89436|nr:hypothetical protein [Streptomyces sp. S465]WAP53789.1 hypothetical protein N6H00_01820 [Streptomyces sp. S465]